MSEFFDPPAHQAHPSHVKARKRRRVVKTIRTAVVVLLVAMLVGVAASFAVPQVKAIFTEPTIEDYTGAGGEEVLISIPDGSTGADIAEVLYSKDVVKSEQAFILAFNENPRANSIQPGAYYIKTKISGRDAVAALLNPAARAEYTITIPEGSTAAQVYEKFASVYKLSVEEVQAQASEAAQTILPAQAGGIIEGWLSPGQYTFMPDTTVAEGLKQMIDRRIKDITELGLSPDMWERQLIIASIVEKEAKLQEDYPKVARTIENRLAQDIPLGVDASLLYVLGKSDLNPSKEELNTDSPYNTRLNTGLPPGPICNPGIEVVKATLNPPEGDWLFWVTVNPTTGETVFSSTYEEHEEHAKQFRQWLEENGQG